MRRDIDDPNRHSQGSSRRGSRFEAAAVEVEVLGGALGRPSPWLVGGAALAAAVIAAAKVSLPGSPFRVPRSWARFGDGGYAATFGVALGMGVATAVPSAGFYVLVLGAASTSILVAALLFLGFALGRAGPMVAATVVARSRRLPGPSALEIVDRRLGTLMRVQPLILGLVGLGILLAAH